jgi:hypothetical protein
MPLPEEAQIADSKTFVCEPLQLIALAVFKSNELLPLTYTESHAVDVEEPLLSGVKARHHVLRFPRTFEAHLTKLLDDFFVIFVGRIEAVELWTSGAGVSKLVTGSNLSLPWLEA